MTGRMITKLWTLMVVLWILAGTPISTQAVDNELNGQFLQPSYAPLPTVSIGAGYYFSCGVRSDGTISCWGFNAYGQASPPSGTFTQVSAGEHHACGLRSDGSVACWGGEVDGEASPPSGTFTQISAGWVHSCGLQADDTLVCWGRNWEGQTDSPSGTFTQVDAGGFHSCGIQTDGSVACWGNNLEGAASPPTGSFLQVAAGRFHTCGLRSDGTVECWGDNSSGQLDAPSGTFTQLSANYLHTCGVNSSGALDCWGGDDFGQASPPPGSFNQVSAGYFHTCGIKGDGSIACWGSNLYGEAPQLSIANPDTATKLDDNPVTIDVLANDSDPNSDSLSIDSVGDPSNGTVAINPDDTLTYTPDPGFRGSDAFSYTVLDGSASATVTVFNLTDLGALTGWEYGSGINNSGKVVGSYLTDCDPPPPEFCWIAHVGVWSAADGMDALGSYGPVAPLFKINQAGQVAGVDWLWTSGSFENLGTLGGANTHAYNLNDLGQVVGQSETSSGQSHAFLWTPPGDMQDLGTLGGTESSAWGVNNLGQVVGGSTTASGATHAFLWSATGGMQDLGTLGGSESGASAINDLGVVVGQSTTAYGQQHAFLWTAAGGMQFLGTLGGYEGGATDINALGQVVGFSRTAVGEQHAFLWTAANGMQDLGTLGGTESTAWAINDLGQIVGDSGTPTSGTQAAMWTFTNQAPVARDDSATKLDDNPVTIDVLANDDDFDGNPLSIDSFTDSAFGSVTLNPDDTITYTPNAGFRGSDAFTYTISDGFGGSATATVTVFNVTDLGELTGWTHGVGINNASQVLGYDEVDPTREYDLGIWTTTGEIQDLGTHSGDSYTINESGQVAGSNLGMAWLWSEGEFQDLGTLGGSWSRAYNLNNTAQIVGSSETDAGQWHAFLWTATDGMDDLGTLVDGSESYAWGINDDGWVVGESETTDGEVHAFLWTELGGMQDLLTLGGTWSSAWAINSSGQVVGFSETSEGDYHAFLWTEEDGMDDLGTLGGSESSAWAINDLGQIVGESETDAGQWHAFLWTATDGMLDLNTLGGTESSAWALNDLGQVVGYSSTLSEEQSAALWNVAPQMNQSPEAIEDTATMLKDTDVIIDVLANDTDPDGDTLLLDSFTQPAHGTVTRDENGTPGDTSDDQLTYMPLVDFYGSDGFTYTVSDGRGGSASATVALVPEIRNDTWTRAYPLQLSSSEAIKQVLERSYQSRWYRFEVPPGSEIVVTLTDLPANYNLTLYKDITASYRELFSTEDLLQLSAEFAPDMFSPDMFSPDMFSPDMFSPDMFSPDMFSPDMFSPDMFSPDMFSPDMFSPDMFSPDMFSPDMFSPDMFSPDMFSPDMFSPDMFSPDMFSPDMFSPDPATFASAQLRSMLAVSASEGTVAEGIRVNSWNNTGQFFVRVSGDHGAYDPAALFHLEVTVYAGVCEGVVPSLPPISIVGVDGGYKTIVITDMARMAGSIAEKTALEDAITTFLGRSEVAGVWVDVGSDARVSDANTLADANPECVYAKNLVAGSIKTIIDRYRAAGNPLEYIVIVGNDEVIPFFRYPDNALLANEMNYSPPVLESTASQASLKLGYVLGQDEYGSQVNLVQKGSLMPLPDLAVGRLVETPAEITHMLSLYEETQDGVLDSPSTALVTGYDFLADAAAAIADELRAGLGAGNSSAVASVISDRLIAPQLICPAGSTFDGQCSWTAGLMWDSLLNRRHDILFLAGHFSASSWLASDNQSRLLTSELLSAAVDLENSLIFSAGCHSGYNIVNEHNVPGVTREPDWAQAYAQKGAIFIGGTGYQYGDTDFVEYSERLYLEFVRQLRVGSGPVQIGQALVNAKQAYLASTAQMGGLHEKSLLQATLYGLPMLGINLPAGRTTPEPELSIASIVSNFTENPGSTLGLTYADVVIEPELTLQTVSLNKPETHQAVYLSGGDGVLSNPTQPVLPVELYNVSVAGTVLRGVGFRGGSYTDLSDVLPLTGAPATEIRGVHTAFFSDYFFPVRPWNVNYVSALVGAPGEATRLAVLPAQYRSSSYGSITGTLRQFDSIDFRLYYSSNTASYSDYGYVPAQAAPPLIAGITAAHDNLDSEIDFQITAVGDPTAGIQEVWVVYTFESAQAGEWLPVDLVQEVGEGADTRLWRGTLSLPDGVSPSDIRYMVQAVNGVGLVSYATNQGAYYTPGEDPGAPPPATQEPTELALDAPSLGAYGTSIPYSAVLTSQGQPVAGEVLVFRLGAQSRLATTDASGYAQASFLLIGQTGETRVSVSFVGTQDLAASASSAGFTITKQATLLTLTPHVLEVFQVEQAVFVGGLTDPGGRRLSGKPVLFELRNPANGDLLYSEAVETDFTGLARLILPAQPVGQYTLSALFAGDTRYLSSSGQAGLEVFPVFDFTGFFPPVDNLPIVNVVKAGSAIPIKFSLNGDQGLDILEGPLLLFAIDCESYESNDLTETVAASNSSLSYDPIEDQYIYVWKTDRQWAGICFQLNVRLVDETVHLANFEFK